MSSGPTLSCCIRAGVKWSSAATVAIGTLRGQMMLDFDSLLLPVLGLLALLGFVVLRRVILFVLGLVLLFIGLLVVGLIL